MLTFSRQNWLDMLLRTSEPVLSALSDRRLKSAMPVESKADRSNCTHLEAFGRTICGLAPWLALAEESEEYSLQAKYRDLACQAIDAITDPASADYGNFGENGQSLVDTAFMAHALIRAPEQLWGALDERVKRNVVRALRLSRKITPPFCNWLLFSAMVETALCVMGEEYDAMRIDYALRQHEQWYMGDGAYGDGPHFRFDYYNSYVIQPMLIDICRFSRQGRALQERMLDRGRRYAEIQERLISPEGTFPVIGRSITYRCGAFQLLAQLALMKELPAGLPPAQVRCALSAVIRRCMEAPGTFDDQGWLRIGLAGHQPALGEHYISTGSLYLCTTAFLPLGLPAADPFWSGADVPWTSLQVWSGADAAADHALDED